MATVKALIGIKEFLKEGGFPPEIYFSMPKLIVASSAAELEKALKRFG